MNEMYSMGLDLHSLGSLSLLVVIFLNLFLLISAKDLKKYKRLNSIFLQPLTFSVFGLLVFTGIIMMAAKHLDFSFANVVMILMSILFIVLEHKRLKSLQYLNATKEHALYVYKPLARTILQIEFLLTLLLALWMWLL